MFGKQIFSGSWNLSRYRHAPNPISISMGKLAFIWLIAHRLIFPGLPQHCKQSKPGTKKAWNEASFVVVVTITFSLICTAIGCWSLLVVLVSSNRIYRYSYMYESESWFILPHETRGGTFAIFMHYCWLDLPSLNIVQQELYLLTSKLNSAHVLLAIHKHHSNLVCAVSHTQTSYVETSRERELGQNQHSNKCFVSGS